MQSEIGQNPLFRECIFGNHESDSSFKVNCLSRPPSSIGFTAFHTRRFEARLASLRTTFSPSAMEKAWSKYVRPGLRDQEIVDLHEYNDIHWGRKQIFQNLYSELCAGRYHPLQSMPIKVEKRFGVTRTLVLPHPNDCIILQCIVEHILPISLKKQPSKNSFFSRSHGFNKPEWKFGTDYIWFRRWVEFSKLRFDITTAHSYVCTTDIANYFDNIDYTHLRNMLSAIGGTDEVILDLLFNIIDRISWRPDYLPSPNRSLPQVNFDAPRLLSHIYLFELDEFLKKQTSNNFVRWVDDITIAVSSEAEAKRLLRDIDQLLMTRGLRLNSGKTQVLSARSAREFFHETENSYLDSAKKRISDPKISKARLSQTKLQIRKEFELFISKQSHGHSDKIVKRYIGLFEYMNDDYALKYCSINFIKDPGIRDTALRYISSLGPRSDSFKVLRDYMKGEHALDDSSIAMIGRKLTEWEIPNRSKLKSDILKLGIEIGGEIFIGENPFFLVASLWIISKYGRRSHLIEFIKRTTKYWETSDFLSRQIASVYPKFRGHHEGEKIKKILETHKFGSALSVIASLDRISSYSIQSNIRMYCLNGKHKSNYSIQRFLICLHVVSSTKIESKSRASLRTEALKYITDPIYAEVLQAIEIK